MDDDNHNSEHRRSRPRDFISKMVGCMEGQGRSRER
jgi:hypothetical protein